MATALYRRYRPEAFAEMIGQAHVTEPLMTALRTERIGHAYLFSGPRGCGKTTSARILARCLNCAEGPTDTPCGTCPSCIELSRDGGGSLDVVEIDAASHGGVDDARDLRERAVYAPARDRYKIFIIDEAHMVTPGGFNALLKIVEEPPPHVKFIFATTEPEKVIGTIRSRTHHYPFRLIAPATLIDYVQQLCDSEGVAVEVGVLPLVVRAGGGSVRDTLSILDQLIAGSEGDRVALDRATGLLGFTSAELIDEVVAALGSGDPAAAFAATDRVVQTGQDPRRFVEDLLERLRDLIVISATTVQGAASVFRGVAEDQLQRMFEQSQRFALWQLSRIADTVSETLDGMVGATAPRLHLELMIARALLAKGPDSSGAAGSAGSAVSAGSGAGAKVGAGDAGSLAPSGPSAKSSAEVTAVAPSQPTSSSGSSKLVTPAAPAAPAPPAAPPVDVIAAMRSARDFLNADSSGASRPPMVPLGGSPTQQQAEHSAQGTNQQPGTTDRGSEGAADAQPTTSAESATEEAPAAVGESVSFADVTDAWPELLEELLENDRDAWNAVRAVQPLELQDETLLIGLASQADLDAFKSSGAGPLREVIAGALGFTVKYLPKQMPAGVRPVESVAAERESSGQPPEEPSPVEPEPEHFEPETEPIEPGLTPDRVEAEQVEDVPAPAPELIESEPEPEPEPGYAPRVKTVEASDKKNDSPGFTRYGEAVVREVFGARFIEEKPLPEGFER